MAIVDACAEQISLGRMLAIGFDLDSRAGVIRLGALTASSIRDGDDWHWTAAGESVPAPRSVSEVIELCERFGVDIDRADRRAVKPR